MLLPTLQSVARRLGQGEMYEGIALDTDPLVMPKGASEIEVRAKQVGSSYLLSILAYLMKNTTKSKILVRVRNTVLTLMF